MGILLAVDYDQKQFEEISEDDKGIVSGIIFKLAKSQPENFIKQLSWTLSDNPDDLFIDDDAKGPGACFHSRIWMESWSKTLGKCEKKSIRFATGRIGGQTIVAIPLMIVPGTFVTRIEFAGQTVSDYNVPVVHKHLEPHLSQELFDAIIQQIAHMFPNADCVDFRKVFLEHAASKKEVTLWQEDPERTHHCGLTGDWDHDLSQFIGKSTSKKLRKKLRKLETFGTVTFEDVMEPTRRRYAGDKLIQWKARQLKDLGAASVYENTGFCNFLKATICNDDSGMVRLFSMNINNEPIALIYALCLEDYWFLYQMSYTAEEPGKYSPGYHLLLNVMERACRQNVKTFDFGWGNEPYKRRFATQSKSLYNVFRPLTLKGQIAFQLCNSKRVVKNLVKSSQHLQSAAKFALRTIGKLQAKQSV
ncbi:MAG: GNAT family N-acetyltransferase [Hyphomicrobiales bacterium]